MTLKSRGVMGRSSRTRRGYFESLEPRRMLAFWTTSEREVGDGLFDIDVVAHLEEGDTATSLELSVSQFEGAQWLDVAGEHVRPLDSIANVSIRGSRVRDVISATDVPLPLWISGWLGDDVIHGGLRNNVINGGPGNDRIVGGPMADELYGSDGDDELFGDSGDDALQGGPGRDRVNGGDGNDHLVDPRVPCESPAGCDLNLSAPDIFEGGAGDDDIAVFLNDEDPAPFVVNAGAGNDSVEIQSDGATPDLTFSAGEGEDYLYLMLPRYRSNSAQIGSATFILNSHSYGLSGLERLDLTGGTQIDTIAVGDTPMDILIAAEAGDDVIDASSYKRDLFVFGDVGNDTILGGAGNDTVLGSLGDDILHGGDGDDWIYGGDGRDQLFGEQDNDHLFGSTDLLDVMNVHDFSADFDAVNDDDLLYGGTGSDELSGGQGADQLFGGDGNDKLYGFWSPATFESDQAVIAPNMYIDGEDRLNGGSGDDELHGYDAADTYIFNAEDSGADDLYEVPDGVLNSGVDERISNDSDTMDFSELPQAVNLDLANTDAQGQEYAPGRKLTLNGADLFEDVIGSSANDLIRGNSRVNHLEGRGGSDILVGEGDDGPELSQGDFLEGGDGGDVLVGDGFDLTSAGWTTLISDFTAFLANFTLGFSVGFAPTGNGGDTIEGGDGDDLVIGGGGDDTITAGDGRALIFGDSFGFSAVGEQPFSFDFGGAFGDLSITKGLFATTSRFELQQTGVDKIVAGDASAIILGGDGDDTITAATSETAVSLIFGNAGKDTITGGSGTNLLFGGRGGDLRLEGGSGFNFIVGGDIEFLPDKSLALSPTLTLKGAMEAIENLFASARLTSEVGDDDKFFGGAGTNIILGGLGPDTIVGGDNQDKVDALFGFDNIDDIQGKAGFNLIVGGRASDKLLQGGDDGNIIIGDHLEVEGFSIDFDKLLESKVLEAFDTPSFSVTGTGFDTIVGGKGFDFLVGGDGQDTISGGDGLNIAFGDEIDLQVGGAVGALQNFLTFTLTMSTIPVSGNPFALPGQVAALFNYFDAVFNEIFGDTSDMEDTYEGGDGNDIVFGGGGDDTLKGGAGKDLLVGGLGDDKFLTNPDEEVIEDGYLLDIAFGGEGNDEFFGGPGPDYLASTVGDDTFHGGAGNDVIFGGDGNDALYGEDGNDTLVGEGGNDVIDGGVGADMIYAGPGNDIITSDPDDQVDDPIDRLPGDTNSDGRVDLVDLNNVRNNFGAVGGGVLGDTNDDGRVDLQDLNAVRNNFGASASVPSALRQRVALAIEKNREQLVLERSRHTVDGRRIAGRVDDLVFGVACGLYDNPQSAVGDRMPGVMRRMVVRTK